MEFGDIDSPEDFHDKQLRSVDELVRCPICCEIMTTATLVIKCLHNFCSICIRRHVVSKKQCPICKEGCSENSLVTNKLINQITAHYKKTRDNLLTLDRQLHSPKPPALPTTNNTLTTVANNSSFSEPTTSSRTVLNTSKHDSTSSRTTLNTSKHDSPQNQNQASLSKMFKIKKRGANGEIKTVGEASYYENVSSSSSRVTKEEKPSTETTSSKIKVLPSSSSGEQECPVCGCSVAGHKINNHLDMCLKRQTREESESKRPTKKKLPNLVLSILSDKALREYCKKYSLTTGGKKPELIKRIKEYTLRYNSQIDQLKQKSDRELAREVEQAERVHLKTPPGVVGTLKTDEDRAAYSNKYDDQFVKLINVARKTKDKGQKTKDKGNNKSQLQPPTTTRGANEAEPHDEIRIIHEVHSTPKKKCNGSLREFFKSPDRTSGMTSSGRTSTSPLDSRLRSPCSSSKSRVISCTPLNSQDVQQFSSPATGSGRHPGCVVIPSSPEGLSTSPVGPSSAIIELTSPDPTSSPVATARDFKSASKFLFGSQPDPVPDPVPDESSGDGDLFGDDDDFDNLEDYVDLAEIERSFTQVPNKTEQQKSSLPSPSLTREPDQVPFSPSTPTKASPLSRRHTKIKKAQESNVILDQILGTEDKAYLEQEVSRLYTFQDENTNSVNTPRISALDSLLQRSYRGNRTLKEKGNSLLNDSVEEMLNNLDKSPAPGNSPRSHVTSQKPDVTSQELPNSDHTIDSPPNEIPDIDDEDLPEFNSLDELPETSPVIETGIRLRKRTSGSMSPFSETPPKRGRIL